MAFIAELSLWLALIVAAWGAAAALTASRGGSERLTSSARRALLTTSALLALVLAALWRAFLAPDLGLRIVAATVSAPLPPLYRLAALWGSSAGIAVVLTVLASLAASTFVVSSRHASDRATILATGMLAASLAIAVGWLLLAAHPLARLEVVPSDGEGLPPMLQRWLMLVHPPAVYVALASSLVTVALAVGARLRPAGRQWLELARGWALAAWIALTIGVVTASWWSHTLMPDESRWASAPLRAGTLFPWLACAGLLHALSPGDTHQHDRWSVGLGAVTLLLGAVAAYGTSVLVMTGELPFASDMVVEVLTSTLVLATGAAAWRARRDLPSRGRRAGGALVTLGVAVVAIAIAGGAFRRERVATIGPGQPLAVRDALGRAWTLTADGISLDAAAGYLARGVSFGVQSPSGSHAQLSVEQRQYMDLRGRPTHQPFTAPAIHGGPMQDLRVTLLGIADETREIVRVRVEFVPLVRWLWLAGALLVGGGGLLWWPERPARDP